MLSEVDKGKWAINFDLDTKLAEKFHPSGSKQGAYAELQNYFEKHNFEHRQYSGYVSKEEITNIKLKQLIERLVIEQPYITEYVRRMDATLIKPEYVYDCTSIFSDVNKRIQETESLEKERIEEKTTKTNSKTIEWILGL